MDEPWSRQSVRRSISHLVLRLGTFCSLGLAGAPWSMLVLSKINLDPFFYLRRCWCLGVFRWLPLDLEAFCKLYQGPFSRVLPVTESQFWSLALAATCFFGTFSRAGDNSFRVAH